MKIAARAVDRRQVLRWLGSAAATSGLTRAEGAAGMKAAVIGHTGGGDYGHGLDQIFKDRAGLEVVAVADPDEAGRRKAQERSGAARSYADYRELLGREKPQLVSVAMRHSVPHHEIILAALHAGAHVYVEKPFSVTPAESDELLAEAKKRGLKIAVAHTMRVTPGIRGLGKLLGEGGLGELVELRAFGKQDARAGGEDLMVLGSHLMDLMRVFAGDPLWCTARVRQGDREITAADARTVRDNVGPVAGNHVFAQYAFARGVQGSFASSARLKETVGHWGLEVWGSKGVARINCDLEPHVFVRSAGAWKPEGRTDEWKPLNAKYLDGSGLDPVGDWLAAIKENRAPACSGENGAWAVEMVLAAYHAALTGGRVAFPLTNRKHPLAQV